MRWVRENLWLWVSVRCGKEWDMTRGWQLFKRHKDVQSRALQHLSHACSSNEMWSCCATLYVLCNAFHWLVFGMHLWQEVRHIGTNFSKFLHISNKWTPHTSFVDLTRICSKVSVELNFSGLEWGRWKDRWGSKLKQVTHDTWMIIIVKTQDMMGNAILEPSSSWATRVRVMECEYAVCNSVRAVFVGVLFTHPSSPPIRSNSLR